MTEDNHETHAGAAGGAEDFGHLFEQSMRAVRPGEIVKGRVVLVARDHVTVDIGYKSEGQIGIHEFRDRDGQVGVKEGDEVDVYFEASESEDGGIVLSRQKAEQLRVWKDIEQAFEAQGAVEGTIVGKVKGGLKVDIGVAAFLPGSHADLRPARNLDRFIGQRTRFSILKFNRSRGNVVVSRRAVMERERQSLKGETLKVLEEGVILEGTVKNITDYGAFVDLGGIDGLLHITDMSWGRIGHPSEVLNVGDKVRVVVLKYDPDRERVSLGMKQIMPDPWHTVHERFAPGMKVKGKVVSLTDYGAFVELEKGVEGLIHVSEMSWTRRVSHPSKVLNPGDDVDVVVLDVDPANRRISLGLKQAEPNPWEMVKINHPVGSRIQGKVKSVTDFGVFVGVDEGIDGLVHVSDLHWTKKVKHPSEIFKKGDDVEAVVLAIDVANERISLGIKQLQEDPWNAMPTRYPVGSKVKGVVTSVTDFGVFVELEEGLEGLIHVSQLSTERIDKPSQLFTVGDAVEAEVTNVDPRERRIGLSIRALKRSEEREEVDSYLRRERESSKFSFEDILNEELRLDRDEGERPAKAKGTLEK
ncbi:MAG: 30S ribosomal protein S1 [Polyangiaceae bacterium UTPRO1]|nr:30S ribosomal protein S1 [Myxococcales bacterium]OQY68879.1 MAG: 30S ribosomal protein S1 [Polyangiaceae bacterium UTPRO1]